MTPIKQTFTFGRNWRRFLKSYTPERQAIAQEALLAFLKLPDLRGKSFLDIGSGSGIHSAAAFLAGASRIHSFDYDPDSVAATKLMHKMMGSPAHWTIEQASVLDAAYMKKLGTFDVVYSWGVLHHTGDQWQALQNAGLCLHDESRLFIALYAKEAYPEWEYWQDVKKRYNEASSFGKWIMEIRYVWIHLLSESWAELLKLPKMIYDYKHSRGMALWSDVRDWLGGWPTEFSSVPEVSEFCKEKFDLRMANLAVGEGNTEFLFMKEAYATSCGVLLMDERQIPACLPVLDSALLGSFQKPVWILGAADGAKMVFDYLTKAGIAVAGFVEPTPSASELRGHRIYDFATFVQMADKEAPVIIANRYVSQNQVPLMKAGWTTIINGHPWIVRSRAQRIKAHL